MSRVEGEASQSTQEAERAQKESDKRGREAKLQNADRQAFGKLLQGQKKSQESSTQAGKQQAQEKTGESLKKGGELAKTALMARAGVATHGKLQAQAKSFQGALSTVQNKTATNDQGRVTTRDTGKQKDKVEHDDRKDVMSTRAESKKDADAELARVEAHEAHRPNAAIGSDDRSGSDDQPKDDGAAAAAAAKKAIQQPQAAKGPQAAREVKQIPPELLEKLVSTVYLAVTEKGLKEFQIELKDGPLKGGFLKISADGGKVSLSFSGLGAHEKNLLEASKGDLMRRLSKKGLSLSKLDFS